MSISLGSRETIASLAVAIGLVVTACAAPVESPGIPPSTADASVASSVGGSITEPTAEPTAAPSPSPTSDANAVPVYVAGSMVETHIGGLRIRARPGTQERVVSGLLPEGANLLVALGPVFVDGYGWYLVQDSDTDDPEFTEGWVAAGFNPDPYLVPTVFELADNPFVAGFAHDANGEYGPVRLTDANYAIRWIAAPPTIDGCSFAVDLRRGTDPTVPAIRATIGAVVAPGVLSSDFFADHQELVGDLFVTVTSNCRWALTFVRSLG